MNDMFISRTFIMFSRSATRGKKLRVDSPGIDSFSHNQRECRFHSNQTPVCGERARSQTR